MDIDIVKHYPPIYDLRSYIQCSGGSAKTQRIYIGDIVEIFPKLNFSSKVQPSRIAAIHGIIAAVAEEVHVAGVEAGRIGLEEAAQAGVIHPVAVIVDAKLGDPFSSLEQETVADRAL